MLTVFRFILYICSYSFLFAALIAPFSFLKPQFVEIVEKEAEDDVKQATQQIIKKVIKTEKLLHRVNLPNFSKIRDVKEKKRKFFNYLAPVVQQENNAITRERLLVVNMIDYYKSYQKLSNTFQKQKTFLVKKYRVNKKLTVEKQLLELHYRVDEVPRSLVLVQAANESAWGTSRFARVGLNFFGIWCYREGCGMVPNGRNQGSKHEVQAFKTVDASVARYLHNINTNRAYRVFRAIRAQLREQQQPLSAEILATGLLPYSERGSAYVLELTNMIRHNQAYLIQNTAD